MIKSTIKICLILISMIGLSNCSNNSEQYITELNTEVVRKYHEIWSTGNVDELDGIISPEFQSHFIGGFEYIGIEGAKNSVLDTKKAFPDWKENIIEIITQEDKVVTRYRSTGTHLGNWDGIEATGNKVVIEEMSVYHLKNGKIIEQWGFWDEIELKKQMTLTTLKDKIKSYEFKNDTLIQKLEVEWETKFVIKFTYTVKNIKRNQEITIRQTAKNRNPKQDLEIDEDEIDQEAYPSEEYFYEIENCFISIRIEADQGKRAVILSEGCKEITNKYCPIESLGVLRVGNASKQ